MKMNSFTRAYDPSNGTFAATGDMTQYHLLGTATLLMNGKVLMAGGEADGGAASFAELYDPGTGTFAPTGNMITARNYHTATLLQDGTVLMAGGHNGGPVPGAGFDNTSSAELYDPETGTFQSTGSMATGRDNHAATLLSNGEVLIVGGYEYYPFGAGPRPQDGRLPSAELYVPSLLIPDQIVTDLEFNRTIVVAGSSFSANFSGSISRRRHFSMFASLVRAVANPPSS